MKQEAYDKQCALLFNKAKKTNAMLTFNQSTFDCNRLNCLWYGGDIATIVYKDTTIELNAYGDIRATLYEIGGENPKNELCFVKDKNNCGRFYDDMQSYIQDDDELQAAIDNGRLVLDNNNWIEYDGNIDGKFIDLGMIIDNILDDSILLAIEQVLDSLDDIVEEIKDVASGN